MDNLNEEELIRLWQTKELSDAILLLDSGDQFIVHKFVLAANSTFFKKMFANEDEDREDFFVGGVSVQAMHQILTWMYTGSMMLSADNVEEITHVINYLDVEDAAEYCRQFFMSEITPYNAIGCWKYAIITQNIELERQVAAFIVENFQSVTKEEEFVNISSDDFQKLIKMNWLDIEDQEHLFSVMMEWVSRQDGRRAVLPELLKNFKFAQVSWNFFRDTICRNQLVLEAREGDENLHSIMTSVRMFSTSSFAMEVPEFAKPPRDRKVVLMVQGCVIWCKGFCNQ